MKLRNVDWIYIGILISIILIGFLVFEFAFRILESKFENENRCVEPVCYDNEIKEDICINEIELPETTEEIKAPFFELTDDEWKYIGCIMAGECAYEPIEGKMAVAQCILNAMAKNGYAPKQVKSEYQYAGWKTDLESENETAYNEINLAIERVFNNGEFVSENPILFFYAYKNSTSRWHETLNCDQIICCHKFFYIAEDKTADWFLNLKEEN